MRFVNRNDEHVGDAMHRAPACSVAGTKTRVYRSGRASKFDAIALTPQGGAKAP
jgi:hypothetical protein